MGKGERERVLEERGHATPRATTVPEFPLELLTSASLSLVSSLYLSCFKSSTISRLISLHCRFACTANTRYDVDAAVGTSLNQSPITRVITNSTSVEGDRRVSRRRVKHYSFKITLVLLTTNSGKAAIARPAEPNSRS